MSNGPSDPLNLDTLRKAARRLRKAHAAGDPDAKARVAAHVTADKALRHADFLHVIAREAGQDSWPKLKFDLESRAMSREQQAERLKIALYNGQHWATEKLLAGDPGLASDNLGLRIAFYDLAGVKRALDQDPASATRLIGVRSPILHLAYSREIHRSPDKAADMLAIAELLVSGGADIDDGYPPEPGSDHKISALYGALCHADNFALGQWLLERGANPNDDESLYHSTELGHTRALALLLKHGARPDGTNALPRALDFENPDMVRLLLEAGADPNVTVPDHPSGQPVNTIPALHQAVRRGRSEACLKLLLDHGAAPDAVWEGHTPYALARIYGNRPAATLLRELGCAAPLSANERVLAACAEGEGLPGRLDLGALNEEDKSLLTRLVSEPGTLDHLKALVAAGLDPEQPDSMGLTPLQSAGWNGFAPQLAYFLSLKPDLAHKNAYGGDALETVCHGAEFAPQRKEADHIACARLLLHAGCPLHPHLITQGGQEDMVAFLESWQESTG